MHQQAQQATRDENLVPTEDRVKIGKSNLRIDPTLTQKEETYQQFWFTIKKVKKPSFYQFDIDNKAYQIDVELKIFNIKLTIGTQRRQGSCYNTVDNDGVLDRLKFISKGEEHQGTKAMVIPKKATVASTKKLAKKKESSGNKSDEQEERLTRRKPIAQLEIDTQKTIKASKHESRFQHQFGSSSEGAGITPEVLGEPIRKTTVSDEGVGTSPEVPDETKDKSKALNDLDDWGSTNDETFLFDDTDEKAEVIPWVSTDEDESD
ncbi:hypothetical protein Tco_1406860 [Tanacetum coccineum]